MSMPLILGCVWVLASAIVATVPMRRQMVPGVTLLLAAPVLLVGTGWAHGWVWLAVGLFAFVSMFRNPRHSFARRALGLPAPLPKELEK